jgi:ribosome-associated heat shock protein Hsp15
MSRLDKWLFHARFYRTRPMAQAAMMAGRVRLNGVKIEKPGHALRPGDVLTLGRGGGERAQVIAVRVLAMAERRGPATEARSLYEVLETRSQLLRPQYSCLPGRRAVSTGPF